MERINPTPSGLVGYNLTFEVFDPATNKFTTKFGAVSTDAGAKVIGAVTNAMIDGANRVKWDYLAVGAKDNIATRISLYARISGRIAAQMGLQSFVRRGHTGRYMENTIVIASAEVIAQLKQDIGVR